MALNILSIFGTRPEAIKMAPVIHELSKHPLINSSVCVSAQHRNMLDQVLSLFEIEPNFDLDIMTKNQTLQDITTQVLVKLEPVIQMVKPDRILVHGDTTTALAGALAAFYNKTPVGHVEAGLRTGDKYAPYPEEMNRRLIDHICDLHFSPTQSSTKNLINENISRSNIVTTGNTVIDSLLLIVSKINNEPELKAKLEKQFCYIEPSQYLILVTGHRRENYGKGFEEVCLGLKELSKRKNVEIIFPVHLNPIVRQSVKTYLNNTPRIHLIEPLEYLPFVYLMLRSHFIITDSGGIQEEAPSIGKPILVTRSITERPEALEAGTLKLVGTDRKRLLKEATRLLDDQTHYKSMKKAHNPYGDGNASKRIIEKILNCTHEKL